MDKRFSRQYEEIHARAIILDETEQKAISDLLRTVRIGVICCAIIYAGVAIDPAQLMGVI